MEWKGREKGNKFAKELVQRSRIREFNCDIKQGGDGGGLVNVLFHQGSIAPSRTSLIAQLASLTMA